MFKFLDTFYKVDQHYMGCGQKENPAHPGQSGNLSGQWLWNECGISHSEISKVKNY